MLQGNFDEVQASCCMPADQIPEEVTGSTHAEKTVSKLELASVPAVFAAASAMTCTALSLVRISSFVDLPN